MSESLLVCGAGERLPGETTLEALLALRSCRVVFRSGLPGSWARWLAVRGVGTRSASAPGQVIAEAARAPVVGLAVRGAPSFGVPFAREVLALARRRGLETRVLSAVSPLGSLLGRAIAFLGGDDAESGAEVRSIPDFLADPGRWNPGLALALRPEEGQGVPWSRLADALSAVLPPEHPIRVYPEGGDEQVVIPLSRLAARRRGSARVLVLPAPERRLALREG
jgi:hypothetical protein